MRALGIILLFVSNIALASLPEARDEYINDFANLIQDGYEPELRNKLKDTEYYSGVEITVVTIESFSTYKPEFTSWESFATALFNKWGVGNLPENDGVMLLIAREGRKVRIEIGSGYASRYDSIMKGIIDETIYPQLERDHYNTGIIQGVDEIISSVTRPVSFFEWYKWHILAGIGALISTLIALSLDKKKDSGWFWILLALAGFLVLGIFSHLKGGKASDGFGGGGSDGGGASGGD
ncbi:TPM domain-containing protein [Halopseudomonas sp.]|uniref:TPM domain-containing protein n=1 Tax=Halopseudomonas sp. TaxID=2901191 RepID=UPI0030037256